MANPVGPGQGKTKDQMLTESEAKSDANFASQLRMNELQEKVQSNNTFITAMSTMSKGHDDVLRAIANNFK